MCESAVHIRSWLVLTQRLPIEREIEMISQYDVTWIGSAVFAANRRNIIACSICEYIVFIEFEDFQAIINMTLFGTILEIRVEVS